MNLKEATARSGLSVYTIRFYQKADMLPRILRDTRGWRSFGPESAEWLRNLERLRCTGKPLKDMRRFTVLVHRGDPASSDAASEQLAILPRHSELLKQRQADLDDCKSCLSQKIDIYQKLQRSKR